jgi:hypothetical protein
MAEDQTGGSAAQADRPGVPSTIAQGTYVPKGTLLGTLFYPVARTCISRWWRSSSSSPRLGLHSMAFTHEFPQFHTVVGGDHLGGLLSDHDCRRIRIPADDVRHDARVGNA